MSKHEKLIQQILSRKSDANNPFSALCQLLLNIGFQERVKGDHHIFTKDGVGEILNLQPLKGKVKRYQVKQVRNVFLKYRIGGKL